VNLKVSYKIVNSSSENSNIGLDLSRKPVVLENFKNEGLIETCLTNNYNVPNEADFDITFFTKMSKVDHTNLKIASLEYKLIENKSNISIIESAFRCLEGKYWFWL